MSTAQSLRRIVPLPLRRLVWKVAESRAPRLPLGREFLAAQFLSGEGIEIGALAHPLAVRAAVKVRYVDRMPLSELRQQYPELEAVALVEPDILDDGESLSSLASESQDFVIANHFVEHCENPLLTLTNMLRVVRPNGVLYMALPDKRFTFDVDRPVSELEHIVQDFERGPEASRRDHFREWVRYIDRRPPEEIEQAVDVLMDRRYSIHFHAWTQFEMLEMLIVLRKKFALPFDVEVVLKNGEEVIFILRKLPA